MIELQSEYNEKKAEVVGKADNEEQATKEQTINKHDTKQRCKHREHQFRWRSKKRRCGIWITKLAMSKTSKSNCR